MSNSVDPDETAHMSRLICISVVCKSLLLSPVSVKELIKIHCKVTTLAWKIQISLSMCAVIILTEHTLDSQQCNLHVDNND